MWVGNAKVHILSMQEARDLTSALGLYSSSFIKPGV